ncbi:hypothetical protein EJV47_16655 [Hymenobacter gummosus]|uniref:Outer membrane protein beta-barrel domain-containing protein n=1 Tax=Hymenobacter gummosus TaxID=1776032 RepID=A0A3S0H8A3_9BACT|nr:hypothetical protein [Hymenobacter gummosus]RTQ48603.1 hypothetical protein EJV47_16655 [Hymenobacter gummosus]
MRRLLLLPLLGLAAALPAHAQLSAPGTIDSLSLALVASAAEPAVTPAVAEPAKPAPVAPSGLTAQPWYRPHHVVLQTAGGQGMVTAGVGYTTLRGRVDVDALAGYVPSKYSITAMGIFTGKLTYAPWTLPVGAAGRWQVRPLTAGALVSYTASQGINDTRDEKYYQGYYWWSARTRIGGFVGGKVSRVIGTNRYGHPRTLGAYYELGTNDLYLSSIFTNLGGLGVHDILTLGLGVKMDL